MDRRLLLIVACDTSTDAAARATGYRQQLPERDVLFLGNEAEGGKDANWQLKKKPWHLAPITESPLHLRLGARKFPDLDPLFWYWLHLF
jgi:hypothetical protein